MVAMLSGYFDESFNKQKTILVFGGWITKDKQCERLESQWLRRLDLENRVLPADKQISRYHAAECSSCVGEFAGWSKNQQIRFSKALLRIMSRRELLAIACGVVIPELIEVFPENANDAQEQAYAMSIKVAMMQIGRAMSKYAPYERIVLFHDWGNYNTAALQAFTAQKDDPKFSFGHFFTTIAPLHWQDCPVLQPADLLAYELMKELDRKLSSTRQMRRFLRQLLSKPELPVYAKYVDKQALLKLRKVMDEIP